MSSEAEENLIRFLCVCGKELEVSPAAVLEEMECPWCTQMVIPPESGGRAAVAAPPPETAAPAELARCPECASPCAEDTCPFCGIAPRSPETYEILPGCREQDATGPDSADWILRKFSWLVRQRGLRELNRSTLVLPTTEWLPKIWTPTQGALEDLLYRLQRHTGLDGVDLRIEINAEAPATGPQTAACISAPVKKGDAYWIDVGETLLADRFALVSTLAHELAHLYTFEHLGFLEKAPQDQEFTTDLLTVALGFGVFSCEASFRFHTWSAGHVEGWSVSSYGYLSQADLSFALALSCSLRDAEIDLLLPHLGMNSSAFLRKARRFFEDRPDLVSALKKGSILE